MHTPSKASLREALRPSWAGTWFWCALALAFLGVQTAVGLAVAHGPPWLIAGLVLLSDHIMHAHLIAFHEAAHGNLCPNRRVNDLVGLLIGSMSGMSFTLFRSVHRSHHAHVGTENDEEFWPFVMPSAPLWQRRLLAGVELLLGFFY